MLWIIIVYLLQENERNVILKKLTLVVSIVIAFSLLLSITFFNTEAETGFTDVGDRYQEAVDYIVAEKYAQGINGTQYGTANPIKRIDAAVMVARVMGFSETTASPSSGFTDVPGNRAWAVDALRQAGVINGKTATSFGSQQSMTRAEMAKIVASAYELSSKTGTIPFTDVNPRFQPYVAALVESGVALGKTATQFGAENNVTRGEFALFVFRGDHLSIDTTPPEVISVD